jgi:hypothetical protein
MHPIPPLIEMASVLPSTQSVRSVLSVVVPNCSFQDYSNRIERRTMSLLRPACVAGPRM